MTTVGVPDPSHPESSKRAAFRMLTALDSFYDTLRFGS